MTAVGMVALAAVGTASWMLMRARPGAENASGTDGANSGLPRDPQVRRAVQLISSLDASAAETILAEELVKQILAARPADVEANVAMASVQSYMLRRGYDISEARIAELRRSAERALALSPDDPDAKAAMASYLTDRRIELPRAQKLLDEAVAARPDEPSYYRQRVTVIVLTPGVSAETVVAAAKAVVARFPNDALSHYDLARRFRDLRMLDESAAALDRTIAISPIANAVMQRARLKIFLDGDLEGGKALLERVPERARTQERYAVTAAAYAMASGNYALGLARLAGVATPWISDWQYTGPTQLWVGELLLQSGKADAARLRFEEADRELARKTVEQARTTNIAFLDVWLKLRLGKLVDARAKNARLMKEVNRPFRLNLFFDWVFHFLPLQALLGQREIALTLMREAIAYPEGRRILRNAIRLDRRLEKFGMDREVVALLADPAKAP